MSYNSRRACHGFVALLGFAGLAQAQEDAAKRASNETLARVGRPGRYAGQFHVVHNVAVDAAGNVYTTEVNTGQRVQKFRRLDPQN